MYCGELLWTIFGFVLFIDNIILLNIVYSGKCIVGHFPCAGHNVV